MLFNLTVCGDDLNKDVKTTLALETFFASYLRYYYYAVEIVASREMPDWEFVIWCARSSSGTIYRRGTK